MDTWLYRHNGNDEGDAIEAALVNAHAYGHELAGEPWVHAIEMVGERWHIWIECPIRPGQVTPHGADA